ncbi:nucleoside diphosphate kinase regulator [Bauldia litoralis]|uniref:GreA/GreB family elongation factor n=1 Tax=Bauldia litoralis TaxID=665467 RepID=A0A1G6CW12_9HYPH|nr:nucleoside diphosphate kinase regulator [Bauldia litoralis]SDB37097.1 GreA/GreB family elongation factor [Bauldia litoralis]
MHIQTSPIREPEIFVSDIESDKLLSLANGALQRAPELAEDLIEEIERATVVADSELPTSVVRMGSEVAFETDDGRRRRRVTLVYPGEADIAQDRISVLTPIGTALIGLSAGQSITWVTRDGREQLLTVLAVEQPAVPA